MHENKSPIDSLLLGHYNKNRRSSRFYYLGLGFRFLVKSFNSLSFPIVSCVLVMLSPCFEYIYLNNNIFIKLYYQRLLLMWMFVKPNDNSYFNSFQVISYSKYYLFFYTRIICLVYLVDIRSINYAFLFYFSLCFFVKIFCC